jgi:crotonobetainyl-CoA:carnitine CoA-transferase CaiB-like acyl-CoA transferase
MSGPLAGLRVIEVCDEIGAYAGKLMADMGAEVVKVEPPGGDTTRSYPPFLDDRPGPERSLWWWHYNTNKLGVTLDLSAEAGRGVLARLVEGADFLLESGPASRLREVALDYDGYEAANPGLITVSITPFGRSGPRTGEQTIDLTVLAAGGPAWMNGYDDHSLPPVRGGGNQGYHTGCHFAVMSGLVALLNRDRTGQGQRVDVSLHAAANVTTEAGTYHWLVAQETVQRQTGRHAAPRPTMPIQVRCADGRYVNTGIPPRTPSQFRAVYQWMEEVGILEGFPQAPLLELGMNGERIDLSKLSTDEEAAAKFAAGRDAVTLLAEHLPAYEFFTGGQERNFQFGIIYSPEEALEDRHLNERGFPVEVAHTEQGASYRYPGAPYRFTRTPWEVRRRAPLLGEDNDSVYGSIGLGPAEIEALRASGTI